MKKQILTVLVVITMLTTLLTGCKKTSKEEPAPTGAPVTEAPIANTDNNNQAAAVTEPAQNTDTDAAGGPIATDPSKDAHWNSAVAMYNDFLNGNERAWTMSLLSGKFKSEEGYFLGEIIEGLTLDIDETMLIEHEVSTVKYALIDCALDGNPDLLVGLTLESTSDYDVPYDEYLVFSAVDGYVVYAGEFFSYYREFAEINEAGLVCSYGSGGANLGVNTYYLIDGDACMCFVYAAMDYSNLGELKIPSMYLPYDTTISPAEEYYTDTGYILQVTEFERFADEWDADSFDDLYAAYQRSCYYTFYDFDGNGVMPEDAYVEECKNDGIMIISDDELQKLISEKQNIYGITAEMLAAPTVTEMSDAPEGALDASKGIYAQLHALADAGEKWLPVDEADEVYYAVCDLNNDGRLELICEEEWNWSLDYRMSYYEVNDDLSGVNEIRYVDGETGEAYESLSQPDFVNTYDIHQYYNDGTYYYVIPSYEYYDTFAASDALTYYHVISYASDDDCIRYLGSAGSEGWYTEYDENGNITSEEHTCYRNDGSDCTEEEFESHERDFFDFDASDFNNPTFHFVSLGEGSIFSMLLESYNYSL